MNKITILICVLASFITHNSIGQSIATYNVVFESFWNASDHGTLPPSPHWSQLVGANHNSNVSFLNLGGIATQGIENIAESGSITVFKDNEVATSVTNGDTQQFINGGGLGSATGTISISALEVNENFPLLTLVSMIAPSPDWIIATNSINLRNAGNTDWQNLIEIDLFVYDAGTDSGGSYTAANADITPHIAINSLKGIPPFNNNRVGKLTVSLQSILNAEETNTKNNIRIYPNPTKGKFSIINIQSTEINTIKIYNILGSLVKEFLVENGVSKINIDFTQFKKGMYLISFLNNNSINRTQKLIVN